VAGPAGPSAHPPSAPGPLLRPPRAGPHPVQRHPGPEPLASDRRRHAARSPTALCRPRRAPRVGAVDVAADLLAAPRGPPGPAPDEDALPVPADDRPHRAG